MSEKPASPTGQVDATEGASVVTDDKTGPLTVGAFREAMNGLPDDAQVFVNVPGDGTDYAVEYVWASQQIPWSHECDEADTEHRPGRDCPKVWGIEVHAQKYEEMAASAPSQEAASVDA